jgi:hypothetical protein
VTVLAGQLGVLGSASVRPPQGDADALAFLSAAGITDPTQVAAVDALVVSLKADGLWSKMKAVYPFVGGTAAKHKWNLKDPRDLDAAYRLTFSGSWTHSATGAKPDGSTAYANSHLNAAAILDPASGSMGFYSRTNQAGPGNTYDMGCDTGDATPLIVIARYNNDTAYLNYGDATNAFAPNTPMFDGRGLFAVNRLSSVESLTRGFKNGASIMSANVAVSLPSREIYVGCNNKNGSAAYFSTKEQALTYIAEGMTAAEHAALYTAVQSFQTTLGRQV